MKDKRADLQTQNNDKSDEFFLIASPFPGGGVVVVYIIGVLYKLNASDEVMMRGPMLTHCHDLLGRKYEIQ